MIAFRSLFLVGQPKKNRVVRLARFCAWGNHWMTAEDAALHVLGSPTTHGMCDHCFKAQMEAVELVPPGAA